MGDRTDNRARKYELGYLIAPTAPENEAADMAASIEDAITDADGEVLEATMPDMHELAYTMEAQTSAGSKEFDRAHFGWIQFSLSPGGLDDIREAVESIEDVMRYLLIRIDESDVGADHESEPQADEDEDESGAGEQETDNDADESDQNDESED